MRGQGKEKLMLCEGCGTEFHGRNQRLGAVLCPGCVKRKAKKRRSLADKSYSAEGNALKRICPELSAVAAAASNAGMTYGKYVAMQRGTSTC